jgi:hypothetical protein
MFPREFGDLTWPPRPSIGLTNKRPLPSKDLTGKLRQIDAFPRAIGEHSDVFRAYRINDERQEVSGYNSLYTHSAKGVSHARLADPIIL